MQIGCYIGGRNSVWCRLKLHYCKPIVIRTDVYCGLQLENIIFPRSQQSSEYIFVFWTVKAAFEMFVYTWVTYCNCFVIFSELVLFGCTWLHFFTVNFCLDQINTVFCLVKNNSYKIELQVHPSCYCVLDLLCVTLYKV